MLSMTDRELEIKTAVMATMGELTGFLADSVTDGASAHAVETGLWHRLLKLGREALQQFFICCGSGDVGELLEQQGDEPPLKRFKALRARPYQTVFGEFHLSRTVYGYREGQKIEYVPLDARLQLPERKFSHLLQDWDQSLAAEMPFGKVNTCLERMLDFKQSVNSLEQSNQHLSASVLPFWNTVAVPTAEAEGELLVMTADGKGVVMRPEEQDDKAVAAAQQQGQPGTKKMALISAVYSVNRYVRTAEQVVAALFRDPIAADTTTQQRPTPHHKRVRGAL